MRIRRFLMATAAVSAMACLPLLGTNGAMLSPMAGTVEVNGLPVTAGSAVVAGDMVSTNGQGSARMVLPGGSVIAAANTNFKLENSNQIRLQHGMVKVAGNLPVAVNTRTIAPESANAQFSVTALNGPVYVQAIKGNVDVKAFGKTYTVHAGEAATFQDQAAPAAAAASSGASLALPVAIGVAAAAAVVTGVVVHQVTKCDNCVTSPSM